MRETPITSSVVRRQRAMAGVHLTEAYLSAREVPEHYHTPPHFSFLVEGAYDEWVDGRCHRCTSGDVLLKPAGMPHRDVVHRVGCSVIVEVLDESRWSLPVLQAPAHASDPRLAVLGRELRRELSAGDPSSELVVEGLVLEILGILGRAAEADGHAELRTAVEFIHDGRSWPTLDDVAAAAGLPTSRVVAAFRDVMRCTVGEYVRRVRVEQAATTLAISSDPISGVAAEWGFSDQSHLTRLFKRHFSLTPAAFRRAVARGR